MLNIFINLCAKKEVQSRRWREGGRLPFAPPPPPRVEGYLYLEESQVLE